MTAVVERARIFVGVAAKAVIVHQAVPRLQLNQRLHKHLEVYRRTGPVDSLASSSVRARNMGIVVVGQDIVGVPHINVPLYKDGESLVFVRGILE